MRNLITSNQQFFNLYLLSAKFPYQVFMATDRNNKKVILKTLWDIETTIIQTRAQFETQYTDIRTSIWYEHKRITGFAAAKYAGDLLKKQFQYLKSCESNYNLNNCMLEEMPDGRPVLIYDYVNGQNLNDIEDSNKIELFVKMIPSLMDSLAQHPHGDLSPRNLILHDNRRKFSIIDPSIIFEAHFFTNTEFYPLVPPLFCAPPVGYMTYPDQLAIGIILYKFMTGIHPKQDLIEEPFWAKNNVFGNVIGGEIPDDIYSVLSLFPEFWGQFKAPNYMNAIRSQLKLVRYNPFSFEFTKTCKTDLFMIPFPKDFFSIPSPKSLNENISECLSDFCMSLFYNYEPIEWYQNEVSKMQEQIMFK